MKKIKQFGIPLVLILLMLAGCTGTPQQPAQTTTAATVTSSQTQATEATTTEAVKVDLEGYHFILYGANDRYYPVANLNQLNDQWLEEYAELEAELNCTFEAITGDTSYENLLAAAMSDTKLGDVVITTQTNYFPGSIAGIFDAWDSEKLIEAGFNVNDAGKWNQFYTQMTKFNGYTWGVFAAGKYITLPVGFFMVFNKSLVAEAGVADLYSVVRNGEWTWDKFLSICEAVTKDLDGDGQIDQWGIGFLPTQGVQMFTNGSGLIGERDGRWVYLGTEEPALQSLAFLNELYQGGYYNNSPDINNNQRSTLFADGHAAFSWVAWYHLQPHGGDPYWTSNHDYGVIPAPKGPSADKYYTLYDGLDAWTIMRSNRDYQKTVIAFNAWGERFNEDDWHERWNDGRFRDEESMEMLLNYIYPNPILNVNRLNSEIRATLNTQVITPVINGEKSPIAAAESAAQTVQAQLDEFLKQS